MQCIICNWPKRVKLVYSTNIEGAEEAIAQETRTLWPDRWENVTGCSRGAT